MKLTLLLGVNGIWTTISGHVVVVGESLPSSSASASASPPKQCAVWCRSPTKAVVCSFSSSWVEVCGARVLVAIIADRCRCSLLHFATCSAKIFRDSMRGETRRGEARIGDERRNSLCKKKLLVISPRVGI